MVASVNKLPARVTQTTMIICVCVVREFEKLAAKRLLVLLEPDEWAGVPSVSFIQIHYTLFFLSFWVSTVLVVF